jgi:phosphoribosylformimino-5-aminoimidazole carboxamide ribotide isomerase
LNDLLSAEVITRIIGVIDLFGGRAVHAIAGDRDHYRPVEVCGGDPNTLAAQYGKLGAAGLYIADLDAITGGDIQVAAINSICRSADDDVVLIDVGWTGSEDAQTREAISKLALAHQSSLWIAATESAQSCEALGELAELVSPDRVLLGLDYRGKDLTAVDHAEHVWVDRATQLGCCGAVILDLATVGTSVGPATIDVCERVRRLAPTLTLYSGGGIRSAADVRSLIQAGCDECLVATALHRCIRLS